MNKRIKELRKELGLSQEDFATKLGVSRGVIANIEGDRVEAKDYLVYLIVSVFNVNADWLFNGIGCMFITSKKDIELESLFKECKTNVLLADLFLKIAKQDPSTIKLIDDLVDRISSNNKAVNNYIFNNDKESELILNYIKNDESMKSSIISLSKLNENEKKLICRMIDNLYN